MISDVGPSATILPFSSMMTREVHSHMNSRSCEEIMMVLGMPPFPRERERIRVVSSRLARGSRPLEG